jgi:hypothetical protein
MRRRLAVTVAAGAVALGVVALSVGTGVLPRGTGEGADVAARPLAAPGSPAQPRPLTYAEGSTIHLGDRTIDTQRDLLSLEVTDDGAAFTTFYGGVWFTDGRTVTQIGVTSAARATDTGVQWGPAGRPIGRVVAARTGSRLAWLEYPVFGDRVEPPEIVVYDTRERHRVARLPVTANADCPVCAQVIAVRDDDVYWSDLSQSTLVSANRGSARNLFRTEVSTGNTRRVPATEYRSVLRRGPRALVVGDSLESGAVGDGVGEDFALVGGLLVFHALGGGRETFDAGTGQRLLLRAPARYAHAGPAESFYLFEWLSDDRFAMLDATAWHTGVHRGEDLLVCTISTQRCTVAIRRPDSAGSPIVPGVETPGSSQAVDRAVADQR